MIEKRLDEEPHSMQEAFGEDSIRESIRQAFQYLHERIAKGDADMTIENTPILSEQATINALLQRYKSMAVGNKVVGAIHSEKDLQEQLSWYDAMIPVIVSTEFIRYKSRGGEKQRVEEK